MLTDKVNKTLPVGINDYKQEYRLNWELLAAASIVVRCTDGRVYSYSRYNELGVKYLSELIDPKTYPAEAHGGFRWIYDSTLLPLSPAESKESRILLTGVIKNRSDVYKNEVIATFVMEYDVDVIRRLYQDANIDGFGGIEVWVPSEPVYPIIQYSKERPDLAYRQAVDGLIASGGSQVVEWNNTLLSSCPIDRVDWHLVGAVDTQGIHAKITELEQDLYVVLLLEFLLAVFLSVMLAFQITRPIKGLIACMKRVRMKEFLNLLDRLSGMYGVKEDGEASRDALQYRAVIQKSLEYIRQNYNAPLSLSQIAERANMSSSYFSKLFKTETGTNYQEYLLRYRLERAKFYLESTNIKINEIAKLIGYNDEKYFHVIFKRIVGCTPAAYREHGADTSSLAEGHSLIL